MDGHNDLAEKSNAFGIVVVGGDSRPGGSEFESRYQILFGALRFKLL